jgi:NUDIX domain
VLPIVDPAGNALVDVRFTAEDDHLDSPASLVVVRLGDAVLLVFDTWRRQWELPGGGREPGETPKRVAIRELREETGIAVADVTFAAWAEFVVAPASRGHPDGRAGPGRERGGVGLPVVVTGRGAGRGHESAGRRGRPARGAVGMISRVRAVSSPAIHMPSSSG